MNRLVSRTTGSVGFWPGDHPAIGGWLEGTTAGELFLLAILRKRGTCPPLAGHKHRHLKVQADTTV